MNPSRQVHLAAFLDHDGNHEAAWRRSDGDGRLALDAAHYVRCAQTAERGLFDAIFLADNLAVSDHAAYHAQSPFEPLTLLAVLATATDRIGLIGTASTTYWEPFHLARMFASLDHLSGGRAAWNIVTSAYENEARNFGRDARADHDSRYARAEEFVDVVTALWDSWADDAVRADRTTGTFFDPTRVMPIDHAGAHFAVRGPATTPRPPQGHPVLVQAGASATGRAFAARHADVVFTAAASAEDAAVFAKDLRAEVVAAGRRPDAVTIMPGIAPVIGSTEAEARARQRALDELAVPEYGLPQLAKLLDRDLDGVPLDGPLPEAEVPVEGMQSRAALIVAMARRESLTVRQIIGRLAGSRGHATVVGTPEQIADELERWFVTEAADGFNVMAATLPEDLELFVDHVVPVLQQRRLFRRDYAGPTLRDQLGLARPADGHA